MKAIAYLGPAATFTEEALLSQPDLADQKLLPLRTIPEVLDVVEADDAELGLVPVENSIEGSVTATLDGLVSANDLYIEREIVIPISLNLCVKQGTKLSEINTVVTHPMAEAQCREWLAKKLPEARVMAANSTAEAAEVVARSTHRDMAAISNRLAATTYELGLLAESIEDHSDNRTRFVLIGKHIPYISGHDKTSIVCFQKENRPGSLLAILSEFASRAIDLTKLESRPTKKNLGDYCFHIDLAGHIQEEIVADCLRDLATKAANVKFLGSYPIAGDHAERREARGKDWKKAGEWIDELRAKIQPKGT